MYINTTWKQFGFIFPADDVFECVLQSASCNFNIQPLNFCCIILFVMTSSRSYSIWIYLNPLHINKAVKSLFHLCSRTTLPYYKGSGLSLNQLVKWPFILHSTVPLWEPKPQWINYAVKTVTFQPAAPIGAESHFTPQVSLKKSFSSVLQMGIFRILRCF